MQEVIEQAKKLNKELEKPTMVVFSKHSGYQVWITRSVPKEYNIVWESINDV